MAEIIFNDWASEQLEGHVAAMRKAHAAYVEAMERGWDSWADRFEDYRHAAAAVGMFVETEMKSIDARKGRHTDVTSIGMAKHEAKKEDPMSKGILARISAFVRLGAARHMYQQGNPFPLLAEWDTEWSVPTRQRAIEINILGWNIIVSVGWSIARISDMLSDE